MLSVAFDHGERREAITLPVLLEDALTEVIRLSLRQDKALASEMLGLRGELGMFGAKIRIAYMMRILAREPYEDFLTISKIRNRFAHDPDVLDFNHTDISALVRRMHIYKTLLAMKENEPTSESSAFEHALHFTLQHQLDGDKGFFMESIRLYSHTLVDLLGRLESAVSSS